MRDCVLQLLGLSVNAGLPSSTTAAAVAKNRFVTRHYRQAVIPSSGGLSREDVEAIFRPLAGRECFTEELIDVR